MIDDRMKDEIELVMDGLFVRKSTTADVNYMSNLIGAFKGKFSKEEIILVTYYSQEFSSLLLVYSSLGIYKDIPFEELATVIAAAVKNSIRKAMFNNVKTKGSVQ